MPLCRPTLPFSSPGKGRLARALYKEEMIRLKQWLASRPFRHNGKVKGPKSVEEGGGGRVQYGGQTEMGMTSWLSKTTPLIRPLCLEAKRRDRS